MATIIKDFASAGVAITSKQYVLPDDESRNIFDETIVKEELSHLKDAGHLNDGVQPLAIIIAGQTGAGKTRFASDIRDVIKHLNPAHFIADVYKTYHPLYSRIIKDTPALASPATGTDARKWLDMACNWAIEHRIDTLVESACRHPEDFTNLVKAFHEGRYRVHVVILAVPECLSLLGIMVRYYKRLPEAQSGNLPLRLTPRKVHYETYDGLLTAADYIDGSFSADHVIVTRRNNLVSYQNARGPDGQWLKPAAALDSLDMERSRPLTSAEHATYFVDCEVVDENTKDSRDEAKLDDIEASLSALNATGSRASAFFPAIKPIDYTKWLFDDK